MKTSLAEAKRVIEWCQKNEERWDQIAYGLCMYEAGERKQIADILQSLINEELYSIAILFIKLLITEEQMGKTLEKYIMSDMMDHWDEDKLIVYLDRITEEIAISDDCDERNIEQNGKEQ